MKHNPFMPLAYAAIWISTAAAVIFGVKYTGSAWCLGALCLPAMVKIEISSDEKGDKEETKKD